MKRKPLFFFLLLGCFTFLCLSCAWAEDGPSYSLSIPRLVDQSSTVTLDISSGVPFQRAYISVSNGSATYTKSRTTSAMYDCSLTFGPFAAKGSYDVYCEVDFTVNGETVTVARAGSFTVLGSLNVETASAQSTGTSTGTISGFEGLDHIIAITDPTFAPVITSDPLPMVGSVQLTLSTRTVRPDTPVEASISAAGASRIELYLNGQELREFRASSGTYTLTYDAVRALTGASEATLYALAYFPGGNAGANAVINVSTAPLVTAVPTSAATAAPTPRPTPEPFDPVSAPVQQVKLTEVISQEGCDHGLGWRFEEAPAGRSYAPNPQDTATHYVTARQIQQVCRLCGQPLGMLATETYESPEVSIEVGRHTLGSDGNCVYCGVAMFAERLTGSLVDGAALYQAAEDPMDGFLCGADPREPFQRGYYGSADFNAEDRRAYEALMLRNGREALPDSPSFMDFLWRIRQRGFGYAAMTNAVFEGFLGREEEFERAFGYPMRDEQGRYNYHLMLVDMASLTEDGWDDQLAAHSAGFFQTLSKFLQARGLQCEYSLVMGQIPLRTESQTVTVLLRDQRIYYQGAAEPETQGNGQHWVTLVSQETQGNNQQLVSAAVLGRKVYLDLTNANLLQEGAFACRISIMR
ncbi:MAG: hypothetical protein IJU12_03290 [Clostridia bacterium]|nr:hypothetical protein [Clostridia bacterium]